jgi:hypothetical protein
LSGAPERIDVLELYIDQFVDIDLGQAKASAEGFYLVHK